MNIILIGLPGSGKTTMARYLSRRLKRSWRDSDAQVEKNHGLGIPEIFRLHGEEQFRRWETEALQALGKQENLVVSTGGGAVERNAELLRNSGYVIYLKRRVEDILPFVKGEGRPLLADSADRETKLRTLAARREPMYEQTAHAVIENTGSIEKVLEKIMEVLP